MVDRQHYQIYLDEQRQLLEKFTVSRTAFVVELLLCNVFMYGFVWAIRKRQQHIRTLKEHLYKKIDNYVRNNKRKLVRLTLFDHVMGFCLVGSFLACVYYKTLRYAVTGEELQLIWLLQPCYIVQLMLIFCVYFPNHKYANGVFVIIFNWMWGIQLAVVFADWDHYIFPYEVFNFWVQHGTLLTLPCIYLLQGRFCIPFLKRVSKHSPTNSLVKNINNVRKEYWLWLGYVLLVFYHVNVMWPIGRLTNVNLNFMLYPGIDTPALQHRYYRPVVISFGYIASYVSGVCQPMALYWLKEKFVGSK